MKGQVKTTAPEPLMSAREAMAYLGVSRSFCTAHAAELGGIKVGSLLKFRATDLDAYLNRQKLAPVAEPVQVPTKGRVRRNEPLVPPGTINPIDGLPFYGSKAS